MNREKNKKAQAILEIALVFMVGLFLFFGIMGIWLWGDRQIAYRQPPYSESRVRAGEVGMGNSRFGVEGFSENSSGKELVWPVYEPEPLTEGEVFGLQW